MNRRTFLPCLVTPAVAASLQRAGALSSPAPAMKITQAGKIANMAEAFELPVAPHTAGGPLLSCASTHLATALTNLAIQESCQVFYESTCPPCSRTHLRPRMVQCACRSCRALEWKSSRKCGPTPPP